MFKTKRQATKPTVTQIHEGVVVAFQKFNGVFLAKISNLKDRQTYAYGRTKRLAEQNALKNYQLKYSSF